MNAHSWPLAGMFRMFFGSVTVWVGCWLKNEGCPGPICGWACWWQHMTQFPVSRIANRISRIASPIGHNLTALTLWTRVWLGFHVHQFGWFPGNKKKKRLGGILPGEWVV